MTPDAATVARWAKAIRAEVVMFCSHTSPVQQGEFACLDCEHIVAPIVGAALTLHAQAVAALEEAHRRESDAATDLARSNRGYMADLRAAIQRAEQAEQRVDAAVRDDMLDTWIADVTERLQRELDVQRIQHGVPSTKLIQLVEDGGRLIRARREGRG
jgi:hypothetical protein